VSVFRQIGTPEPGGIVAVCDHASNRVPGGIDLGIATEHGIPAHLACVSRLVIDLHREEDSPGLIPERSDGHAIEGNLHADRQGRIETLHRPYHAALAKWLDAAQPALILSIHSFTPMLETRPEDRPWHVGLLYNEDDRAARIAIRLFEEQSLIVGDNEPYSGRLLNATMNRHAEAYGRPYCTIEVRNDLIADEAGQARWAARIARVANGVALALR
jgi:predicted N-formylglutamate amidohydrolase